MAIIEHRAQSDIDPPHYVADSCAELVGATERGDVRLGALVHGQYPGIHLDPATIPEVLSIGSWDDRGVGEWALPRHRNEGIEFTFVENGTLSFATDGQDYVLEPNAMTVTRPWQAHSVGTKFMRANRLVWLILDVQVRRPNQEWIWPNWVVIGRELLAELSRYIRENETPVWRGVRKMRSCFGDFARLARETPTKDTQIQLIKIKINEMLLSLLEHYRVREPELSIDLTSNEYAVQIYLERLSEDPAAVTTLEDMARRCGISTSSFAHYCRKLTNMSPVQYLTSARIRRAKELLGRKATTVLDTALETGFSSAQYFSTVFRRHVGMTPSQYRDRSTE